MATYCTIAEVKANTQDSNLASLTDEQITALIEQAEIYIDAYAGYWEKYDIDQSLKFPRSIDVDKNGATFIPSAIKHATIAQIEFIYQKTPDIEHGIEEDDKPTKVSISPRAKELMRGYMRRAGRIKFEELQETNPDRALFL